MPNSKRFARLLMNNMVQVEQVMLAFVDSNGRQHNMPAMARPQRQAVHLMAQAFALTTQSFGQEPNRHVRLLKVNFPPKNPIWKLFVM